MISYDTYILNKCYFPLYNKNLGLYRNEMPQISEYIKEFLEYVIAHGFTYKTSIKNTVDIIPTQCEFNHSKINSFVSDSLKSIPDNFIISKDNYLLDGHHRIAAKNIMNTKTISVIECNMLIQELLHLARTFELSVVRNINDMQINELKQHVQCYNK